MSFLCDDPFDFRQCTICDCTTSDACVSEDGARTCAWYADDICDFCALGISRMQRPDKRLHAEERA